MAQLDCGSCGYLCKSYAEAIANGSEKDLTKCTPGGRETARMLKQLQQQAPAQEVAPPVQRSAGTAAPKAP
ncbi:MAG TPA: (Fe-S)-binding protein, partial [Tepidisphaeraceae bacterium]|nr:(Fe-S)-binding protein [Tepidisphaeraceae bacterium]